MKTVRIQYLSKDESTADMSKYFEAGIEETKEAITRNTQIAQRDGLLAKFPDCHAYFIDDVTVDILVPDDFDVSVLGGTVVKSDGENFLHEWLGHEKTSMVVDKQDTREEPVKITTAVEKEPIEGEPKEPAGGTK